MRLRAIYGALWDLWGSVGLYKAVWDLWGTVGSVELCGIYGAVRCMGCCGICGAVWDLWGCVGSMGRWVPPAPP